MSRREEESGALADGEQAGASLCADVHEPFDGGESQAPVSSVETGPFFVVGIGASAGGFEALVALLQRLEKPTRAAFVVVQHLMPSQASALPELLRAATRLEVLAAADGTQILPDRVYVIPPNAELAVRLGILEVTEPVSGSHARLPIDFLFRSIAKDVGGRAIGIVLSGTGSDGTLGLRAIKQAGGRTFVQDPESARYDGMPRSAIESGVADFCLFPEAMADVLARLNPHSYRPLGSKPPPRREESNNKLLSLIRDAFGTDLRYYKPATIDRRAERRLALHKIERMEDYVKFVASNPDELRLLYKDILIGVTSFFRDPEVFEALETQALARIVESKTQPGAPIRFWVPACSTGEEAYSIAIVLSDVLGDRLNDYRVQIFASDIDADSVQKARRGIYPRTIALDVPPERLERYFVKREDGYQIARRIRDMVVFSNQNLTSDAPFSKLDLVSCRNLLIYLQPPMQRKVLRTLHYALRPGGFLLLGTSETVGDSPDLFSLVDRASKLYTSKHAGSVPALEPAAVPSSPPPSLERDAQERSHKSIAELADRKILEIYGPPGVVIDDKLEILHFRGRTGPFLEPLPGAASLNILRLARAELHADLRRAIQRVQEHNVRVTCECKLHDARGTRPFRLEVLPITEANAEKRCFLVLFHEPIGEPPEAPASEASSEASEQERRIEELEREILLTKEYLQSTVEELESVNEELRSSNEELQSANEELEGANEELQTSKEELFSANQELSRANSELEQRMLEQQRTLDDLQNVMAGVDGVVVVTGLDLRIRRFTESAERTLGLGSADLGRSVGLLNDYLGRPDLEKLCADVMETLSPSSTEVKTRDERWFKLRITPYRTLEQAVAGTVLVLSEVDVKQQPALSVEESTERASRFLEIVDQPLMIVDSELSPRWANRAFYEYFRGPPAEALGQLLRAGGTGQWADRSLADALRGAFSSGGAFHDHAVVHELPGAGARTLRVSGSRIPGAAPQSFLVLLSFDEDVT